MSNIEMEEMKMEEEILQEKQFRLSFRTRRHC